MSKTIKIHDSSYKLLNKLAGELRMKENRPVSLEEIISTLVKKGNSKPSDYAGGWDMEEKEASSINRSLKQLWSSWKLE